MIKRIRVFMVLAIAIAFEAPAQIFTVPSQQNHVEWVGQALIRMQTIKVGMTRDDLLKVFTTEGGLSMRLQRTYVSRDCPYFKVDAEFRESGPPGRNGAAPSFGESGADVIVKISRPYLDFAHAD